MAAPSYAIDSEVVDGTAYGVGWGLMYKARLPDGPAKQVRELLSPETFTLAVVEDEVVVETP